MHGGLGRREGTNARRAVPDVSGVRCGFTFELVGSELLVDMFLSQVPCRSTLSKEGQVIAKH